MKRTLSILFALVCALYSGAQTQTMRLDCGTWITLTATPFGDYAFAGWSDGDTARVRSLQVNDDATYIAFFESTCREYANWPVVVKYDWLLMLNMVEINALGYYFGPEQVSWYQVVGLPDSLQNGIGDDLLIAEGSYYLTLDKNLQGSGDYYAQVDVSSIADGSLCTDYMRSVIVHFASPKGPAFAPFIEPSIAPAGSYLTLHGLDPDVPAELRVFDPNGRSVETYTVDGEEQLCFKADLLPGCYFLQVVNGDNQHSLRFIITW